MKVQGRSLGRNEKNPAEKRNAWLSRLSVFLMAAYALLLVPVLWIGKYDAPSADDFSMGLGTRLTYEATGSVLAVLGKIVSETVRYYRTWIGYFASCLFTTASPSTFGDGLYFWTPVLILLGLHVGVILFLYVLMERTLGMDRTLRCCMTVLVLFLMVQRMPEGSLRVEAFYWYSGAGNYTLTFALGLIYLSFLLLSVYGKRKKLCMVLASVTGLLAGGGNYLSALSYAIVTAVLALGVLLGCTGRGRALLKIHTPAGKEEESSAESEQPACWPSICLVPMMLYFAGFALSCMAPGNRIRGGEAAGFGAVKSVLLSLYYTLSYPLGEWMNWAVLLVLAMAGVIFWMDFVQREETEQESGRKCSGKCFLKLSFSHPLLVTAFAYGLVSATVTPSLFAQGNMDAGRIQSTFWLHGVLVLAVLEWYLVGGLYRHWQSRGAEKTAGARAERESGALRKLLGMLALFFVVFSLLAVKGNPDFYTASAAVSELLDGSAAQYGREQEERLAILQDPSVKDAVLPRYTVHPELLFFADVSEDPEDWANQKMSEYYGKDSIRAGQ